MLNTSKTMAFVATKFPNNAREFYENRLGLSFISDTPFAMVFDSNGTMLRVQKVQEHTPASHTVLGWEVEDILAKVKELNQRGVLFERYEWMDQDEFGVWIAPGGAKIAWFKDPDGNVLSLTQF
jgi:catechol 2,3-dioxygenase-like lactoylglutathione lyase family enzyme